MPENKGRARTARRRRKPSAASRPAPASREPPNGSAMAQPLERSRSAVAPRPADPEGRRARGVVEHPSFSHAHPPSLPSRRPQWKHASGAARQPDPRRGSAATDAGPPPCANPTRSRRAPRAARAREARGAGTLLPRLRPPSSTGNAARRDLVRVARGRLSDAGQAPDQRRDVFPSSVRRDSHLRVDRLDVGGRAWSSQSRSARRAPHRTALPRRLTPRSRCALTSAPDQRLEVRALIVGKRAAVEHLGHGFDSSRTSRTSCVSGAARSAATSARP